MKWKEIPFFSVQQINRVEDYVRFRHCKAYLKGKSDECKDENVLRVECGYSLKNSVIKFRHHRKEWDNLERKIPLKYLSEIGVDLDTLKFTVELDQEEFDRALEIPFYPRIVGFRVMAAVFSQFELPENTSEREAIEVTKRFAREKGFRSFIPARDLKTIYVEPNGAVFIDYYRPSLEITETHVQASSDGSTVGKSYIG
ncbi:MAG: hypothetical protein ABSB63_02175 [Spirochaetia bacterium]|jgi:hypothetical protein